LANELEERAIQGDEEALTELLERTGPVIRRDVAERIPARWRSVLSEDDVMQQTYADAFRGITRFVPLGQRFFWAGCFSHWPSRVAFGEPVSASGRRIGP